VRFTDKRDANHFPLAPLGNCWIEHVLRYNQEAERFRKIGVDWHLNASTSNTQIANFHIYDAVHARRYNLAFLQNLMARMLALTDIGVDIAHVALFIQRGPKN
jgi:hypothetical protein